MDRALNVRSLGKPVSFVFPPVIVRMVGNVIHWIKLYPVDSVQCNWFF